jgi:hypothetical protein
MAPIRYRDMPNMRYPFRATFLVSSAAPQLRVERVAE